MEWRGFGIWIPLRRESLQPIKDERIMVIICETGLWDIYAHYLIMQQQGTAGVRWWDQ